jgi:superfamily I DNA/RNA helicase
VAATFISPPQTPHDTDAQDYRDVARLGRKTRLKETQRAVLWSIFEKVRAALRAHGMITNSGLSNVLAGFYAGGTPSPFDFAVVDEAQDISIAQLRFLAALGGGRTNSLFFAGDLGQRIFQQPFSWKALGVDVRGRSTTLKINYRTSHQIRSQADRLLDVEVSDVDGNSEERKGTISVFDGPAPGIKVLPTIAEEISAVGEWLPSAPRSVLPAAAPRLHFRPGRESRLFAAGRFF